MKKLQQPEKINLHARNAHRNRYDFDVLTKTCVELSNYVAVNKFGDASIDFSNPDAVKILNKALLKHFYHIEYWDIPTNYLCPPIPGRADYIHYIADLLSRVNGGTIPTNAQVKGLDIGIGANVVYPLIGNAIYGWQFVGSDIDTDALQNAQSIIDKNFPLADAIFLRKQQNPNTLFKGIIHPTEKFDFTMCNPPFHESAEEARQASIRKVQNLSGKQTQKPILNFGGNPNELWCVGGEKTFIQNMIAESVAFSQQFMWFTTLVSKQATLPAIFKKLEDVKALETIVIEMSQGQKSSRLVAWTFLSKIQQKNWRNQRWRKV